MVGLGCCHLYYQHTPFYRLLLAGGDLGRIFAQSRVPSIIVGFSWSRFAIRREYMFASPSAGILELGGRGKSGCLARSLRGVVPGIPCLLALFMLFHLCVKMRTILLMGVEQYHTLFLVSCGMSQIQLGLVNMAQCQQHIFSHEDHGANK